MKEVTQDNIRSACNRLKVPRDIEKKLLQKIATAKINSILIGWKQILWSLSPFMHTYSWILQDLDFSYLIWNMDEYSWSLNDVLNLIEKESSIKGGNVTMPFKIEVYKDFKRKNILHSSAIQVWAVNTIWKEEESLIWINTDRQWIYEPIKKKLWDMKVNHALILWAWWAAQAACAACIELWIKKIDVLNRSDWRIEHFAKHFNEVVHSSDISIHIYEVDKNPELVEKVLQEWSIVISALPFWFKPWLPKYAIDESLFPIVEKKASIIFDVVYDLSEKFTPFCKQVQALWWKSQICTWLDMVIHQAKRWFELRNPWASFDVNMIKKLFWV